MRFDVPYAENKNYGRATSNCQVRKGPTDMDDACSNRQTVERSLGHSLTSTWNFHKKRH